MLVLHKNYLTITLSAKFSFKHAHNHDYSLIKTTNLHSEELSSDFPLRD